MRSSIISPPVHTTVIDCTEKANRPRRYREKDYLPTVCCKDGIRIEDEIKGWGTLCKDGSVLWDTWRPPDKKLKNTSWAMPVINQVFPKFSIEDIMSVQPMTAPIFDVKKLDKKLLKKYRIKCKKR